MKIGFLSMPLIGHLHPMTALGRKMQARGNEVTFFGLPDAARIVHSAGLDFVPFGEEEYTWAENHGLQIDWDTPNATISKLAVITQTPKEFDFPDVPQAPAFHYAGPFHDDYGRERVAFPWERLTGEPLIYSSMGTLVNGLIDVFRIILKAAAAIPGRQLVLSIGSNIQMDDIGPIPANAIVVSKAPQIELLKQAELCIIHAGINTTLESLTLGVPMVAIPVGFDQPGIAARIVYHGVGRSVPVASMNKEDLSRAIQEVLGNPSYRDTARRFQRTISTLVPHVNPERQLPEPG
jgi:MGT family glycosyltransferase